MNIPVLETPRLKLRAHCLDDFAESAAMWADPVVTKFFGRQFDEEEVWARYLRYAGNWAVFGYGFWVLEEKETGRFAGEVGYMHLRRDIQPHFHLPPEVGWILPVSAQGKGYATEAAIAAIAWGDAHVAEPRTTCIIHPENLPSIRVAEKCGFRDPQPATYKGSPTLVFVRDAR